jgi:hypothetical protein
MAVIETAPIETTEAAPVMEVVEPAPVISAPLQSFEVTEHAPTEITLEKVMEQAIDEQLIQPVTVEEHITAHPLEAPQVAHSEVDTADQTHHTEESDENTTTE